MLWYLDHLVQCSIGQLAAAWWWWCGNHQALTYALKTPRVQLQSRVPLQNPDLWLHTHLHCHTHTHPQPPSSLVVYQLTCHSVQVAILGWRSPVNYTSLSQTQHRGSQNIRGKRWAGGKQEEDRMNKEMDENSLCPRGKQPTLLLKFIGILEAVCSFCLFLLLLSNCSRLRDVLYPARSYLIQ